MPVQEVAAGELVRGQPSPRYEERGYGATVDGSESGRVDEVQQPQRAAQLVADAGGRSQQVCAAEPAECAVCPRAAGAEQSPRPDGPSQ